MKNSSRTDQLERALAEAHRQPRQVNEDAAWQADVMRDIRRLRVEAPDASAFYLRWAAVASLAAVLLVVTVFRPGLDPSVELVKAWSDDPAGFTTGTVLGF